MRAISASSIIFLSSICVGTLSAERTDESDPCCCPAIMCQGEPFEPCELPAGYAQYGGFEVEGCIDFLVSGEFLYWKPVRRNYVDIFQFENDPDNTILMRPENASYRPGFRVGIGITLPNFDDWTLRADYTWYHHNFTRTFNAPVGQSVSPVAVPLLLIPFTSIQSTMKFDYDDVKVTIHRAFYAGCRVICDPYFGMRAVFRKTELSQVLTLPPALIPPGGIGTNFQNAKVHCWYPAVCVGGNLSYLFGAGFRFLFTGEVALAYERISKNSSKVINNSVIPLGATVITQDYPKQAYAVQGMGIGSVGLAWGSYFCCQRYHFDLSASYELNGVYGAFYDYNTVLFLSDTQFRGLTVQAQFDF